jgi:hypothetical protein
MLTELQQRLDGLYHDARRAGLADVQATAAALPDPRDLPAAFGAPTTAPAEGLRFIISDDPPFFTYALAWWLPVPFGYHALSAVEAARAIEAGAIPRGTAPALAALAFTGLEADGSLRRTPKWITPPRPRRSRRPRPAREPPTSRVARPPGAPRARAARCAALASPTPAAPGAAGTRAAAALPQDEEGSGRLSRFLGWLLGARRVLPIELYPGDVQDHLGL